MIATAPKPRGNVWTNEGKKKSQNPMYKGIGIWEVIATAPKPRGNMLKNEDKKIPKPYV